MSITLIRGETQIISESIVNNNIQDATITLAKLARGNEVILSSGEVPFAGVVNMGGNKITNLVMGPEGSSAVTRDYLSNFALSNFYQDPVLFSIQYIGIPVLSSITASEGEYCLNISGNILYQFTGGAWTIPFALESGMRFLFNEHGSDSSGNSGSNIKTNKIYTYDNSSGSFVEDSPESGWVVFRLSDGAGLEFDGDSSPNNWFEFTGLGLVEVTDGLYKNGNIIGIEPGDGLEIGYSSGISEVQVKLNGSSLAKSDLGLYVNDNGVEAIHLADNAVTAYKISSIALSDGLEVNSSDGTVRIKSGEGVYFDGSDALILDRAVREIPIGDVDGVNTEYSTITPFIDGTEELYRNGILQIRDVNYTTDGFGGSPDIPFVKFNTPPLVDDTLRITYVRNRVGMAEPIPILPPDFPYYIC